MTTESGGPTVQRGLPDEERLLDLLNEAYGGWGTRDLLEWSYHQYPNFEPKTHCFYIERDGDLAAFRRVFEKHVRTADGDVPIYVLGDTSVGTAHRGQGLYSSLHSETTESFKDDGVISTFNRVGNITYEANLDRGWVYRTLPLRIRILDYSNVIGEYATNVVPTDSRAYDVLSAVDRWLNVRSTGGDSLVLTEEVLSDPSHSRTRGPALPVPESVLDGLVKLASTPDPEDAIVDAIRGSSASSRHRDGPSYRSGQEYTVEVVADSDEIPVADIVDRCGSGSPSFRREKKDVEHMLQYPGAEAILTRTDGKLDGFAVLGPKPEAHTTEGRVLDFLADSETAMSHLIDALESLGVERGYDTLVATAPIDRDRWIPVGRQVMMWLPDTVAPSDADALREARMGMYDVA